MNAQRPTSQIARRLLVSAVCAASMAAPLNAKAGPGPATPSTAAPTAMGDTAPTTAAASGPKAGDPDPTAAAVKSGASLAGAGVFFFTYGAVMSGASQAYDNGGGLGFAVGGLVGVSLGSAFLFPGVRRLKNPNAWLAKGNRHGRMSKRAARRGWTFTDGPTDAATARKGKKQLMGGFATIALGGGLIGGGAALGPLAPGAGLGMTVVGLAMVPVGIPLIAAGKRNGLQPGRVASLNAVPSALRTAQGETVPGLSLSGRF